MPMLQAPGVRPRPTGGRYRTRRERPGTFALQQRGGAISWPELTLEHFERFCLRLRLDNGKPFELEPFQREILADYFGGVKETLVLLPSGNGKTTLYAAIALHHMLYTPDPEAFIMASSRDQAGRMLTHIRGFIGRTPDLERYARVTRRKIELVNRNGFIEILASDADTADGIGPTLAIIDELHRHKTDDLYVVALKGLKKRGGQILHCSTAGDTIHSPLGRLRARGLALPGLRRDGMHTSARSTDRQFAFHEWALARDDDAHDMRVVKQANPLSTITEADLASEHDAMTWWQWARFACGLWLAGASSAISPLDLAKCWRDRVRFTARRGQLLSIDLAWVGDCTAITAVQAMSEIDVRVKKVAIITPTGDGTALREESILRPIREYARDNHITGVVLDPEAGGRALIEKLEDLGLDVIEHSQKNEPMCDAARKLDQVMRRRVDPGDPDGARALQLEYDDQLGEHMLAAEAKVMPDGSHKLVKRRKNPEPIDGAVSVAMGVRVALAELDDLQLDTTDWRIEQ